MESKPNTKQGIAYFSQSRNTGLEFHDYFAIIRAHLLISLCLALFAGVGFWYFNKSEIPEYLCTSSLIIEKSADQILNIEQVVDTSVRDENEIDNHISQIQSRRMRTWVLSKLDSSTLKAITTDYTTLDETPSADSIIANRLTVKRGQGRRIIEITVAHRNIEIAALLSNYFAEEYVNFVLNRTNDSNQAASTFLRKQVESLSKQVEEGEYKLQEYRQKQNLVSLEETQNLVLDRLKHLDSALSVNKINLLSLEARVSQIRKTQEEGNDLLELAVISNYQGIPELQNELESLLFEKTRLSSQYLAKHPKIVDVDARIVTVEKRLEQKINRAVAENLNQLETAQEENRLLSEGLAQAEAKLLELDKLSVDYNFIRRKLDNDKRMFDQVLERLNETEISKQILNSNIRPLDSAETMDARVSSNKKKNILYSVVLAVSILIGFPIFIHLIDQKAKNASEIEQITHKPILGEVRLLKNSLRNQSNQLVCKNIDEPVIEDFRSMYGNISMVSDIEKQKTIMVTSTLPGEGKSFVASNLAATYANHGYKTLLIDCDLRKPSLHRGFGIDNERGVVSYLEGNVEKSQLTQKIELVDALTHNGEFHCITSGGTTQKPTELLETRRFSALVKDLKDKFDIIVIDTPPAGLFPDALFMSSITDEMYFVIRHHQATRSKIKSLIKRFDETNCPLKGVVINAISRSSMNQYSYHRYGYGAKYSSKK